MGGGGTKGFDASDVSSRVFLCMAIITSVSRIVGYLFRKMGQPAVIGEIIAGLLLGPSVLGQIPTWTDDTFTEMIFPYHIRPYLQILAQLGLLLFMFVVGLEVDLVSVKKTSRTALVVAVGAFTVPFVTGAFALGLPFLYPRHKLVPDPQDPSVILQVDKWPFSLFIGVAVSITAFPVLARIIDERRMFRLPLGTMVLSAAAFTDVVAWVVLTIALALAEASSGEGSAGYMKLPVLFGAMIGLGLVLGLIWKRILAWTVVKSYTKTNHLSNDALAFVLVSLLVCGWFVHEIAGLHALLGAFLFGILFPRVNAAGLIVDMLHQIESITVLLLLPLFFIVTGLSVDITKLGKTGVVDFFLVLLVSMGGKLVPGILCPLAMKFGMRRSLATGILMNTRGLTEIVILNIGRDSGLLDENLFTVGILMAIVTTVMAGPFLAWIYPRKLVDAEIREIELKRMGGGGGGGDEGSDGVGVGGGGEGKGGVGEETRARAVSPALPKPPRPLPSPPRLLLLHDVAQTSFLVSTLSSPHSRLLVLHLIVDTREPNVMSTGRVEDRELLARRREHVELALGMREPPPPLPSKLSAASLHALASHDEDDAVVAVGGGMRSSNGVGVGGSPRPLSPHAPLNVSVTVERLSSNEQAVELVLDQVKAFGVESILTDWSLSGEGHGMVRELAKSGAGGAQVLIYGGRGVDGLKTRIHQLIQTHVPRVMAEDEGSRKKRGWLPWRRAPIAPHPRPTMASTPFVQVVGWPDDRAMRLELATLLLESEGNAGSSELPSSSPPDASPV